MANNCLHLVSNWLPFLTRCHGYQEPNFRLVRVRHFTPLYLCTVNIHHALQPWRNPFSTRLRRTASNSHEEGKYLSLPGNTRLSSLFTPQPAWNSANEKQHHPYSMEKVFVLCTVPSLDRKLQFESFQLRRDQKHTHTHQVRSPGSAGLPSSRDTESGRFILFDSDFSAWKSRCLKQSL